MEQITSTKQIKFQHKKIKAKSSPEELFEKAYKEEPFSFILESMIHIKKRGRYSFLGGRPFILLKNTGENIDIEIFGKKYKEKGNPFIKLRELMSLVDSYPYIPGFSGGAVGYLSYDAVRFFEKIPDKNPDEIKAPETYFMFPSEIILFDHKDDTVDIIIYNDNGETKRIEELTKIIKTSEEVDYQLSEGKEVEFIGNFTKEEYCSAVEKAKEYIYAGDIFQVVPSQRFKGQIEKEPINIYKALRLTNPSPYMYYLRFNDLYILGSSPETLIKLEAGGLVTSNPIAGTRRRGKDEEEDKKFAKELLSDEKELAEHVMLVDLARNDIGRVCEYGSIRVSDFMRIEKYAKVMHNISVVNGNLLANKDAFDLVEATFPAGTVSGAPKIRAMEIIDELEPVRRGIYAGALGYFGFAGIMDLCIAIRTIVINKGIIYFQAGGGVVADSVPELEYKETINKMSALKKAIEISQ
ncbi:anthranilate synthase component I [candidate division WOR-3 bacterium]|nr:anthranilate synthase component I [candidate division WOR-3 bacterium]